MLEVCQCKNDGFLGAQVGVEDRYPVVRVLSGEVAVDVGQGEGVGTVGHNTGEGRR